MARSRERVAFDHQHYLPRRPEYPERDDALFGGDIFQESPSSRSEVPPAPQEVHVPVSGASVDLRERTAAIKAIVASLKHQSQMNGAAKIRQVSGNKFDAGYRQQGQNPDARFEGMQSRQAVLDEKKRQAIETLNATGAMAAAGFDEDSIRASRRQLEKEIDEYRTGRASEKTRKNINRITKSPQS